MIDRTLRITGLTGLAPRALLALLALLASMAACFDPDLQGTPCGINGSCPPGLSCDLAVGVCVSDSSCEQPPCGDPPEPVMQEVATTRNEVDLLFVVDNSSTMQEEQTSLSQQFDRIVSVFTDTGQLPSLHVGVISTDMGVGPFSIPSCAEGGDGGRLHSDPVGGCPDGPSGAFIQDVLEPDGTRTTNYSGTLAETFACIAQLGTAGCGFERTFESIVAALDGSAPENAGFLRDDALLGVFILSDEDDCSVSDPAMYDPLQNDPDGELGSLSSFRCFEFGVACAGDVPPREPGDRVGCQPRESAYMRHVDFYVDAIADLKPNGRRDVVVGQAVGPTTPVAVGIDGTVTPPRPLLNPSCVSPTGDAVPAVRLDYFARQFPRNRQDSICRESFTGLLSSYAADVSRALHRPCISDPLYDTELTTPGIQPSCTVVEQSNGGETPLPPCSNPADPTGSDEIPCFLIAEDPACDTAQNLAFEVVRVASVLVSTAVATCLVEPSGS